MGTKASFLEEFESEGRVWLRDAVDATWMEKLRKFAAIDDRPGARAAPETELFRAVCEAPFSKRISEIWDDFRPNRVVGFNKTSANNWALPWH